MGNLKLNDLASRQPEQSLISQANEEEKSKVPQQEVKFENLGMRIQPTEGNKNAVPLGESGVV